MGTLRERLGERGDRTTGRQTWHTIAARGEERGSDMTRRQDRTRLGTLRVAERNSEMTEAETHTSSDRTGAETRRRLRERELEATQR